MLRLIYSFDLEPVTFALSLRSGVTAVGVCAVALRSTFHLIGEGSELDQCYSIHAHVCSPVVFRSHC